MIHISVSISLDHEAYLPDLCWLLLLSVTVYAALCESCLWGGRGEKTTHTPQYFPNHVNA